MTNYNYLKISKNEITAVINLVQKRYKTALNVTKRNFSTNHFTVVRLYITA